jgi:hypothetical protein
VNLSCERNKRAAAKESFGVHFGVGRLLSASRFVVVVATAATC